jgi:ABC-type multidrug transport system ATPase subunit
MIGRLGGLRAAAARRRASQLLETFDLADAARKVVKSYSGGMKRRLDVAASLVARPRVLFLDEPTTGLDPRSRSGLWELIRSLVAEGATVLLTTQYLEEADRLAESILVVDHGHIVASGSPDQLKAAVGGQVLEVRTVEASELATTAGILSGLAGVEATVDRGAQLVTAPIPESALLGVAVRRLDEAKVTLSHLELRRPSLEEVFLTLTGPMGTDGATAEAADGADGRTADGAAEPAADGGNGQGERR